MNKVTGSSQFKILPPQNGEKDECVILLHGLARSSRSMKKMARFFQQKGYAAINAGYPSTTLPVEKCADYLAQAIHLASSQNFSRIHFITHSLGGIVLRYTFRSQVPDNIGKVVMLSPPNHGSEIVDTLGSWKLFQWINGPAGQQLTTFHDSIPNTLGAAIASTGIITGDRHAFFDKWFSSLIKGDNDGKVSVESARLENMRDFLVVHESHPFIMNAQSVLEQSLYFIQHGRFYQERQAGKITS